MTIKERMNRILPVYGWLPLIAEFMLNNVVYGGAKLIAGGWYHRSLETAWDRAIPFASWTVLIYFGCFAFWAVNYVLCVRQGREEAYRFLSADCLAKWICLLFFLLLPTTNTRPEITGNGICDLLMRFLYRVDSPDNLFPSIHCLTSWMCYIGIRGRRQVPFGYRIFSCLMAVAVFVSTQTTKQHVLVDVAAGVILAEGCYFIAGRTRLSVWYGRFFDRMTEKIFRN